MNGFQWMCAKLLPELRETAKERQNMKTVSITTIAAMLLVGCGESKQSFLLMLLTIRLKLSFNNKKIDKSRGTDENASNRRNLYKNPLVTSKNIK